MSTAQNLFISISMVVFDSLHSIFVIAQSLGLGNIENYRCTYLTGIHFYKMTTSPLSYKVVKVKLRNMMRAKYSINQ